jgi:effector-binding domain-containing protein
MKQTTEGAREGIGAKLSWSGNDKVGTGSQIITSDVPDQLVATDLDFGRMGVAKSAIVLVADGRGTKVTWTLDSDLGAGPVGHYFGLMMDRMIGKDYARGLVNLKRLVESMPDTDIAGFTAQVIELSAQPIAVVSETSAVDVPAISKAYADGYAEIGKFMKKNSLKQSGAPLGINGEMSATSYAFDAAVPIDRANVAGSGRVKVTQSYAGKALKTVHVGPYDDLGAAYAKFGAYLAAHAYTPKSASFSWYVDDPAKTPATALRTEIYWPIE